MHRAAIACKSKGSVSPLPGTGTASANLRRVVLQLVRVAPGDAFCERMLLVLGLL